MDSVRVDFQLDQKISKRRFFQDIKNSFQWVIGNGLKPTQFFSFQNISTNTVARDVQSFGRNGPWLAGWLSNGLNFFVNLAQTGDEQTLKISRRYLHPSLINCWLTENLLQQMASCCTKMRNVYSRRPFVTTNFQSFNNNSNKSQDIVLKFSACVHHKFVLNWHKNFGRCSISLPATAHCSQNFERL